MATHAIFSTLGRPRKESQELKARLGYIDLISQQQGAQLSQGAGLGGGDEESEGRGWVVGMERVCEKEVNS